MRKLRHLRRSAAIPAAVAALALVLAAAGLTRTEEPGPVAPGREARIGAVADAEWPGVETIAARLAESPGQAARERPAARAWHPHVAAARRYARRREGDVSFAVVGPFSRLRAFHGARRAPAASTIKALLLATYLRSPEVRDRDLDDGERAMLEPMIEWSDNDAGTAVATIVGGDAVTRLARAIGMRDFEWVGETGWLGGLSQVSARDMARFLDRFPRYVPARHRRYARHLLHSVTPEQLWGVGEVVPPHWRLYLKGGWGISDDEVGTVEHQVAFLERGRCRLSLAILTEHNSGAAYGVETLEGVARRLLRGIESAPCGRGIR